jgi:hypothetical protein
MKFLKLSLLLWSREQRENAENKRINIMETHVLCSDGTVSAQESSVCRMKGRGSFLYQRIFIFLFRDVFRVYFSVMKFVRNVRVDKYSLGYAFYIVIF